MAADHHRLVANHGFTTYIDVAAALHFLNSIPNAVIAEYVAQGNTKLRDVVTRQKIAAKDGYLDIPEDPGLGVELDDEAIRKFRVA